MVCKSVFGDRCMTVFVRRNKEDIVTSLLERDVPTDDKVRRLMTLDKEMENEQLCDWTVSNNGSLEHAIQQILRIVVERCWRNVEQKAASGFVQTS